MSDATEITVFTSPLCTACDTTKNWLKKKNIPFRQRDIRTDEAALEEVQAMGYRSMPVVVTPNDHWSGLRIDKLMQIAA